MPIKPNNNGIYLWFKILKQPIKIVTKNYFTMIIIAALFIVKEKIETEEMLNDMLKSISKNCHLL